MTPKTVGTCKTEDKALSLTHDVGLPAVRDGLKVVGGDLAPERALRRPVHARQVHALGAAPTRLEHKKEDNDHTRICSASTTQKYM